MTRTAALALACGLVVPAMRAGAQPVHTGRDPEAFINQQRAADEHVRAAFAQEAAAAQQVPFDFGGWYSQHLFLFDDGVESSRTLRRHDLRLWGRLTFDRGTHEFYARTRLSLLDFNTGDSFDGNDDDVEGINLERGYYRFDPARALGGGDERANRLDVTLEIGRDLVTFGTGLTLATPLDHVAVSGRLGDWRLDGLAGRTVGSTQDFDLSRTAKRTRRALFGAQLNYRGLAHHEPFVYALWQRDHNHEARVDPFQRFDYDSTYFGIGSTGELRHRLRYLTEWVIERGRSYGDGQSVRSDAIRAWAGNAALEYLFPGPYKARASLEYLLASGDGDRVGSPTNAIGGNRGDRVDSSFVGLGWRNTGLALAPRYSNLHMLRAGASLYPWPDHARLGSLEVGTDWFVYHKHHRGAAVSDPTAGAGGGYLGWAVDGYANWAITVDLAWTARLGAFFPGAAFGDRTTRTFMLVGITWSF